MFLKETQIKKKILYHYVSQVDGFDIFVDLPGYENPSKIFYDAVQPDLVLKRNHHISVIELTCFKTNLVHSWNFKIEKYKYIKRYGKVTVNKTETLFLEVSSLGFIAKTFKPLQKFGLKSNINCNRLKQKMSETSVKSSYYICTRRIETKNGIIHSWWNLYDSLASYTHGLPNISVEIRDKNGYFYCQYCILIVLLFMPNKLMKILKKSWFLSLLLLLLSLLPLLLLLLLLLLLVSLLLLSLLSL